MKNLSSILKNKKVIFALSLLLASVLIVVGMLVFKNSQKPTTKLPEFEKPKLVKIDNSVGESIVTIQTTGFFPQTVKIKKGSRVTWSNSTSDPHQIKSDPHPLDNLFAFLNTNAKLMKNERITLTFKQPGTYAYHDELNPLQFKGVIIVE